MNQVILAYSRLPRQLPVAIAQRWRTRLSYAHQLRLSVDAQAQARTLLGAILACYLLGEAGGSKVEPSQLRYSAEGKPTVPGLPEFSIAHTGDWVVCALASTGAVGVDLEMLDESPAPLQARRAALTLWTTREAVLKAAGATLAELPQIRLSGRIAEFRGRRWHCSAPRLAANVVARLATARPLTRLSVQAVRLSAL